MKWAFSWGKSKKSTSNTDLTDLQNLVNGLTNKVNELSANLTNYVTLTNANNLFVSKNQPITLTASRNNPVNVSGASNNPVFIEFIRNNNNMGYVGLGSGSTNNINLGARSGNLNLEVGNGNSVVINNATIQGVANPVNNTDAANKQYVDGLNSTLTNRLNSLENNNNNNNLSVIYGKVYINNPPTTIMNFASFNGSFTSITLTNGTVLPFSAINKYLISYHYWFNSTQFLDSKTQSGQDPRSGGMFIKPDSSNLLGIYLQNNYSYSLSLTWINTTGSSTRNVIWKTNEKPYFTVTLILAGRLENITNSLQINSINSLGSDCLEVTSWDNVV